MENCNPMEVLFQRRCSKHIYVVPEGLRELMSDISREVLRCNPQQINKFIADFLDSLLITRENARVACKLVDQLAESSIIVAQMISRAGVSKAQAVRAAKIIQRAYRKYKKRRCSKIGPEYEYFDQELLVQKILRRCDISFSKASAAAVVIQRTYRCYRLKLETEDPCAHIDWSLAARKTIGILRKLKVPKWELERAATLIKAAYKGYYTRKLLKQLTKVQIERTSLACKSVISEEQSTYEEYPTETAEISVIDYDVIMHQIEENAAIVIQNAFRTYWERKKKKTKEELLEDARFEDSLISANEFYEEETIQFPL